MEQSNQNQNEFLNFSPNEISMDTKTTSIHERMQVIACSDNLLETS
jgi:hypothetical protein